MAIDIALAFAPARGSKCTSIRGASSSFKAIRKRLHSNSNFRRRSL